MKTGFFAILASTCLAATLAGPVMAQAPASTTIPTTPAQPNEPAKATPAPFTINSFAALPMFYRPDLSPNGQNIAAKISVDGKQYLSIISLFDQAQKPVTLAIPEDKFSVDSWEWVNDDWLLLRVSANDFVQGDRWRLSRVMAFGRVTKKLVPIGWKEAGQNASDVLWVAQDGTPQILLKMQTGIYRDQGFYPEVRLYDISTGKYKTALPAREHVMDYYADGTGNIRMGYGYNPQSRTATLIYRESGKGSFRVLDRANLKKDEELSFPTLFLAEPGKALTISDTDGYDAVYELDLATMTQGKKVFGVPGYDIDALSSNATDDGLMGVRYTDTKARVHWLDPDMAKLQAELDKAVGARNAWIISFDKSRRKMLIHVGSASQPGNYYYYDRDGSGAMRRLFSAYKDISGSGPGVVSTIKYKARDGMEMSAVLTLPKGTASGTKLPLILLPHGGPHVRDDESWDWMAQFLAWRGYAVVQPNYRGSSGFGTAFMEAGEGQWGLKMQDDLNDAVDHLAKQSLIDDKRVCIMGASYGGYAAMRGAQRDGARYRCAISYAGVSDLGKMIRYDSRYLYGEEYKKHLKEQAPDFNAVSPLRWPEQFSTPILLMHGKVDMRVPVEQSRDMAQQLKTAGKVHRYVEQPLGDHHFSREADRLQFLQEVDAFLRQYNPSDKAN